MPRWKKPWNVAALGAHLGLRLCSTKHVNRQGHTERKERGTDRWQRTWKAPKEQSCNSLEILILRHFFGANWGGTYPCTKGHFVGRKCIWVHYSLHNSHMHASSFLHIHSRTLKLLMYNLEGMSPGDLFDCAVRSAAVVATLYSTASIKGTNRKRERYMRRTISMA